jgi:membrane-associated phospholipid phosphatase
VAAVFWVRDRARYWRYVRRFVTLSFAAALTFVLYPAIPPWMAARFGEVDPIVRTAPRGWGHRWIHLDIAQDVIHAGWDTANLVAAVPSLHAGYTALVAVMLWPTARTAVRVLLALYVVGMGFVLVLSGEHYVFDLLAGWAYVAVVCLVWNRLERPPVPFWRLWSPQANAVSQQGFRLRRRQPEQHRRLAASAAPELLSGAKPLKGD